MKISTEIVTPEKIRDGLPDALRRLPPWRREKAQSFHFARDQYLCAKSFLLLQQMVSDEFGYQDFPPFSYGAYGKPFWKEYPQLHFSISHCETGIACALSHTPVGIDIERVIYDRALAEEVLSPSELADVLHSTDPAQRFITYWTMKESFLKLRGTGLENDLRDVLAKHSHEVLFETRLSMEHGYVMTAAAWKDGTLSD